MAAGRGIDGGLRPILGSGSGCTAQMCDRVRSGLGGCQHQHRDGQQNGTHSL